MRDEGWSLGLLAALALIGGGTAMVAIELSQRERFMADIWDALTRWSERTGLELSTQAKAILVSQAVLESGAGRSVAWRFGNNFGNVTAGSSWTGDVVKGGDLEYTEGGGAARPIVQRFRKYATVDDAVADFFQLLGWSRYRAARDALDVGDGDLYAAELRRGGYFTAPLGEYQRGLQAGVKDAAELAYRRGAA